MKKINFITSGSYVQRPSIDKNSSEEEKRIWFQSEFKPQFQRVIIESMKKLVKDDPLIGFIFMSCVIDYLAGFTRGENTRPDKGKAYKKFISDYLKKQNTKYGSKRLYLSLRNGLVHMFTVNNAHYELTAGQPSLHLENSQIDPKMIILNAENFEKDLENAANSYFDDVETTPDLLKSLVERYCKAPLIDVDASTRVIKTN